MEKGILYQSLVKIFTVFICIGLFWSNTIHFMPFVFGEECDAIELCDSLDGESESETEEPVSEKEIDDDVEFFRNTSKFAHLLKGLKFSAVVEFQCLFELEILSPPPEIVFSS